MREFSDEQTAASADLKIVSFTMRLEDEKVGNVDASIVLSLLRADSSSEIEASFFRVELEGNSKLGTSCSVMHKSYQQVNKDGF
jgi:hypothetical protein